MPNYGFEVGLGPSSLMNMPTRNVFSPTDTDASTKLVHADEPMRWARTGSSGYSDTAVLCAENEIPELISTERCQLPHYPIGAIQVPHPDAASGITQHFVLELPIDGAVPAGDEIGVVAKGGGTGKYKLVALAGASLNHGVIGNNNALTFAARLPGVGGNNIRLTLTDPPGNNAALAVDVVGNDINVTLATDGASAITTTAEQLADAIRANGAADELITVANQGASTGAGVVTALAQTALAGGAGGVGRYLKTTDTGRALVQF